MNPIVRSILAEYTTEYSLYQDFCLCICSILEDMLRRDNYKYHISSRVKDKTSLEEKIKRKKKVGKIYKNIQDIKDISGVRVIFYSEIDKKRFIKKIKKEFGNNLEIKTIIGKHGYSSTHILASLNDYKSLLFGYERYKNLQCEIQLTLMLEHAWAEIEHDVLYKANMPKHSVHQKHYENLKIRMENIMSQYIKRASMELESITREMRRIKSSKK